MQQLPGVTSVGIVSGAGQLVTSNPPMEAEVGNVAMSMFANLGVQIKRMQRGTLKRILLETEQGITLLSGLADGSLMVVFVNSTDGFNLSKLMETAASL
ncbi:hypothetical protein COW36_02490 [bacterium (Candidatus Blackallbacteria) CG17_big_fil_post_rev_8_21_14_2_50_48_46]|uniref:Roadblock/LAMTOR2 domain-containing protein n=1 Tax=bacterium (Candidatus Blackallbacteria) CG17_big_fil_post_rev_8_21_14_2_50_48_46 TaxID=2014261 RepID=A0A2M7GA29_9BACT|nr:MAG: hypothetical protein COW64_12980 [bacterium (Candidatus Blackallbacteria) CG18_big_fil_WC_8_21_14_2_50_49_26]PIW18996.1 MAG: hypothetical protein COW36_02490 [bacterium (Candidatus Blackallbacteria) CG17_big_fil_post_rev_8_21_14_2_50_48_46]PIW44636.1 MAG: hypothetical protein COW20_23625 [bacterium (Candidatus Blackallbacteria) CG13_big_fil_rev_8_21_14_2_50_49_14]